MAKGHAETLTDAKNFTLDIARPRMGVDCDEGRLQDKCCSSCYMQCGVLKSNEDMILALAGQFKQLSHEPEKFR